MLRCFLSFDFVYIYLPLVSAGNNSLTGSIPSEVGDLISLRLLNLENNGMTGTIPLEATSLTDLEVLDLGK